MSSPTSLGSGEDLEALFDMLGGGQPAVLQSEADYYQLGAAEAEELDGQLTLTATVLGRVVGAALDEFFAKLSNEELLDKYLPAVLGELYCEEEPPTWLRGAVLEALEDEVQVEVSIVTGEAVA